MTTNSPNPVVLLEYILKKITSKYLDWSENIETLDDANTFINSCKYTRIMENKKSSSGEWYTECREFKVDSTGICYDVACFVQEYIKVRTGLCVELFFIWRSFDPEYAEDEDDTLHAGVYFNGKYYDTYNPEGVTGIEKLKFYQKNSCNGKLFTNHGSDWLEFGKNAFKSNKEYKFMRYLNENLNPVDGDVQALIGLCKIEIKRWKDASESNPNMRYMLTLMETALSSLAAKPETPACFVTYWPDTDDESDRPHSKSNESCARRIAGEIGGYVRPCFILDDGMKAFTTPPAQLLRPVELPESQRLCNGYYFDMNDVFEALEEAGIPFKVKS